MSVTSVSVRTSTPSFRSSSLAAREARRVGRQEPRPAFEQHDRGFARIDVPEIALEGSAGSRQPPRPSRRPWARRRRRRTSDTRAGDRIGLSLGALEGQQNAAADLERIVDILEPGGERLPFVVSEVGMAWRRGRGPDSHSGSAVAAVRLHLAPDSICDLGEDHLGVFWLRGSSGWAWRSRSG